jgi:hypothetical protein
MKRIIVSALLSLLATLACANSAIQVPFIISNQTQNCLHPVTLSNGTIMTVELPILQSLKRTLHPGESTTFITSVSGFDQGLLLFSYHIAPSDLMTPELIGGYQPQGGMFVTPIHWNHLHFHIIQNRYILSC